MGEIRSAAQTSIVTFDAEMNNSGGRSAVRVIRLDEFELRQAVQPTPVIVDEPEPAWSSLPSLHWPDPIGSGQAHAPAAVPVREPVLRLAAVPRARPASTQTGLPRLPHGVVTTWPVRFQGVAQDFAGLWMRNLLLTVLSLGLYLPWARVSNQRYLMRHTRVAGHALDYHEPAIQLLPRYALGACLVLGVAGAWLGSPLAGMLALSLALSVWPLLVFMSLNHRMAHISWAHRRMAFDGLCQDVYRAMWAPLAGGGALAWLLMAAAILRRPDTWVAWGVVLSLWVLAMPAFVWTWFHFRQRHLRAGPLRMLWKADRRSVVMLFARTLAWTMLTTVFSAGLAAVATAGVLMVRGRLSLNAQTALLMIVALCVCAAVHPFAQARLQNLVWNKTGNRWLRFRSKLPVAAFVRLQCWHALLLLLTAGLYWPWALIATRRMRTHALTVWSRVDADVLKAHWPVHASAQAGKMAGSPAQPPR